MSEMNLEKLNEFIERVSQKQNNYVQKYCDNAPRFVVKNVLNLMLSIQRKISGFNLINNLLAQEYKYIKSNNSRNKLYARIYKKSKKSVDYLKENYYYSIVEDYIIFMHRIMEKVSTNEYQKAKIEKLVKSLELEEFIQNHSEYYKIHGIFEIVNKINKIKYTICVKKSLHYYMLNKEVFLEYEELLNKVLNIKDNNLKRAVLYYLEIVSDFKEISLDGITL